MENVQIFPRDFFIECVCIISANHLQHKSAFKEIYVYFKKSLYIEDQYALHFTKQIY